MKILIALDLTAEERQRFLDAAPNCELEFVGTGKVTLENARDAEAIFGNPPRDLLPRLTHLRFLQLFSAGCEGYDAVIRQMPGARLFNASGAYGLALAEYMLAGLFMLMKKLHLYRDRQPSARWERIGQARTIDGARILALGLGDVGTMFAARAKALGAHVIGMKRTPAARPDCVDELYTIDALDAILPTVDAVCMSLPDTPGTRGILSAARIASMKPGAYVVNAGRGSAIDQDALAAALNDGCLGGAVLDVTVPEPLPAGHPLWTAANCVVTPHIAGGLGLPQTREKAMAILVGNLHALATGGPLTHEVDLDAGY